MSPLMCCGTQGGVLWKLCDFEIYQDGGGVINFGRCVSYGRKIEWRCRWEHGIHILQYLRFGSYLALCWLMNTKWPRLHHVQPPGPWWMRRLKARISTRSEDCLLHWALLWDLIPHLQLRPRAFWSKLSSSQVVPTVEPCNTATNALQGKKPMQLMS
jgi:hypothetical protein